MMRVLVCGGCDLDPEEWARVVELQLKALDATVVITGNARGGDRAGNLAAEALALPLMLFPAHWRSLDKSAGVIRNGWMLQHGKPDFVIALPGGRGTQDMVQRAEKAGIPVSHLGPVTTLLRQQHEE